MFNLFTAENAITPWVLAILLSVAFIAIILTVKSLLDAKRTPYYFQRQVAMQKTQNYVLSAVILLFFAIGVFMYGTTPQTETTLPTQEIANAKPIAPKTAYASNEAESDDASSSSTFASQPVAKSTGFNFADAQSPKPIIPTLPKSYSQLKPEQQLNTDSGFANVTFSTDVSDKYAPIAPADEFLAGSTNTIYATFDYEDLENGVTWAWVWRQDNGEIISGGEKHWDYGNAGPGYVFMSPPEGISEGSYDFEMWLNGQLVSEESFDVTTTLAR